MSSDSDEGTSSRGGSYIKLRSRKKFAEWKRKTEALASQQGYKRYLTTNVAVVSESDLEDLWAKVEAETDTGKQKQLKIKFLKKKGERKLNATASCMLMMAVPAALSKKLEAHSEDPFKMFKMIEM